MNTGPVVRSNCNTGKKMSKLHMKHLEIASNTMTRFFNQKSWLITTAVQFEKQIPIAQLPENVSLRWF